MTGTEKEEWLRGLEEGDVVLLAGRHSHTEAVVVASIRRSPADARLSINERAWADAKTGRCLCTDNCTLYYREPTAHEHSTKLGEIERDRLVDTLRMANLSTVEARELLPAIKKLVESLG